MALRVKNQSFRAIVGGLFGFAGAESELPGTLEKIFECRAFLEIENRLFLKIWSWKSLKSEGWKFLKSEAGSLEIGRVEVLEIRSWYFFETEAEQSLLFYSSLTIPSALEKHNLASDLFFRRVREIYRAELKKHYLRN